MADTVIFRDLNAGDRFKEPGKENKILLVLDREVTDGENRFNACNIFTGELTFYNATDQLIPHGRSKHSERFVPGDYVE